MLYYKDCGWKQMGNGYGCGVWRAEIMQRGIDIMDGNRGLSESMVAKCFNMKCRDETEGYFLYWWQFAVVWRLRMDGYRFC